MYSVFNLVLVSSLAIHFTTAQVSVKPPDPSASDLADAYPEVTAQNRLGTKLIRYTDCNKKFPGSRSVINQAYSDFNLIANTEGVYKDINWFDEASLEFLGPDDLNKNQQAQIQAVFANLATVSQGWLWWPFIHYIHVRCDDPEKKCQPPKNDPCRSPNPKVQAEYLAYAANPGFFNKIDYPYINFCPSFFNKRTNLKDAIAYGKGSGKFGSVDLTSYRNQAEVMFHEMTHLYLAADSSDRGEPNPEVIDLEIAYFESRGIRRREGVYGPLRTKILARFVPDDPNEKMTTGYYVQRNADNLAQFALAMYVRGQIGKYPYLPQVHHVIDGPPHPPLSPLINLLNVEGDNGHLMFNSTEIDNIDVLSPPIQCWSEDDTSNVAPDPVNITALADNSLYPQSYIDQVAKWLKDLSWKDGIPSDTLIGTGDDLTPNFPKWFILDDSKQHDLKDMYYRLRDKACQKICDETTIANIPSNLVRAARQGDTGCEYSVKVSKSKEMYFYTTNDGQNCYDATELMLLTYAASKTAFWINGPNPYEFYQLGIRDVNTGGPGGASHSPFPDDGAHLGYLHLACRRSDGLLDLFYRFELKLSNWDDGNWGKSIQHEADKCEIALGTDGWKYEPEDADDSFTFRDGTEPDHWSQWRLALTIPDRCGERSVEKVLGLKEGSVSCPQGSRWAEVDMFAS